MRSVDADRIRTYREAGDSMQSTKTLIAVFALTSVVGCSNERPRDELEVSLSTAGGLTLTPSVLPAYDVDILSKRAAPPPPRAAEPPPTAAAATPAVTPAPAGGPTPLDRAQPAAAPTATPDRARNNSGGAGITPVGEAITGVGVQSELSGGGL
jgi:pyruvate/2-oxoglutarate dehydrogenase complex dihydrolipoamide acyltransferase (E2) component